MSLDTCLKSRLSAVEPFLGAILEASFSEKVNQHRILDVTTVAPQLSNPNRDAFDV